MSDTIYLYGFVPERTSPPPELAGIAGRPVEVVNVGPFGAAVSHVPAETYAAGAIEPRLRDLDWVGEQGIAHERVVTWFVDESWILPARLLTLYSSLDVLEHSAAAMAPRIQSEMDRLQGCREWDLKVTLERERFEAHVHQYSDELADLDVRMAAAPPGTRYLLEKKRLDILRAETDRVAGRLSAELLDAARAPAVATEVLPPPRDAPDQLPVILTAALLLRARDEVAARETVRARAAELDRVGLGVAFSGPWAPYRFLEAIEEDGSTD